MALLSICNHTDMISAERIINPAALYVGLIAKHVTPQG